MATVKGLLVFVYRDAAGGDCTNGGVTGKATQAILVGDGIPGIFDVRPDLPALRIVKRAFSWGEYVHAEPVDRPDGLCGPMFGGNFIHSSDARFPNKYPIPVHDRFETQEMVNSMD